MTQTIQGWTPGIGVLAARRIDKESQIELAERLTRASGVTWTQSKVSRIERGDTQMSATDLRLFSQVQSRDYTWYLDGVTPGHLNHDSANPHVARSSTIVTEAVVEDWLRELPFFTIGEVA